MRRTTKLARKIGILLVGLPLLVLGIILIPLPGPGLLVCFLALFILSTEFEWANRYYEKVKETVVKLIEKTKQEYKQAKDELKEKDKK